MQTGYDVIGDIHGQANKLVQALEQMGYQPDAQGAYHHPARKAVFVGDLIDRGPGQLDTLRIARAMIDRGHAHAILGNHELNAIALATPHPDVPGTHQRKRTDKNLHQNQKFLDEVGIDSPEHARWIQWFKDLPVYLELPGIRVVHACWDEQAMAVIDPHLDAQNRLGPDILHALHDYSRPEIQALDILCKGPEIDLPDRACFSDAEGNRRTASRICWWNTKATNLRELVCMPRSQLDAIPALPIDQAPKGYDGQLPVVFGHYWMTGTPGVLSGKLCCVDFSAAHDHQPLVAYRFDGETELSNDKLLVCHPAAPARVPRR